MLAYENKIPNNIRKAFTNKVTLIGNSLGFNPNWLMIVMMSESGLNPKAQNNNTGGKEPAVGLIQWLTYSAAYVGTTIPALQKMDALQQLDYVYRYFKPAKGKIKSILDLYTWTFYPQALGKPNDYVLGSDKSPDYARLVAKLNSPFDSNKDQKITLGEFMKAARNNPILKPFTDNELGITEGAGIGLILILGITYYFKDKLFRHGN